MYLFNISPHWYAAIGQIHTMALAMSVSSYWETSHIVYSINNRYNSEEEIVLHQYTDRKSMTYTKNVG